MPKKTKETRINEELQRLQAKFTFIDGNQRTIVAPLLQNAAFIKITLDDLQEIINTAGVVDTYQNGANQYGTKPSAAVQSYNNLAKTYASIIKQLSNLMPPEKKEQPKPWEWQPEELTPEEEEARAEEEMAAANERARQLRAEIDEAVRRRKEEDERHKQNNAAFKTHLEQQGIDTRPAIL